jgi:hypothetical protein
LGGDSHLTAYYLRVCNCDMRGHRKSQLVPIAVALRDSFRLIGDPLHECGARRRIQWRKCWYRRRRLYREWHKILWRRKVDVERPGSNFHALQACIAQ